MRSRKPMSASKWIRIGLAGLSLILILSGGIGCATVVKRKPIPPILEPVTIEGHVCFTQEDAKELGLYLLELEGE